jgi:lipopolysaccharide biosynthesis regulator YciM
MPAPAATWEPELFEFETWYLIALPLLFGAGWALRSFDARVRSNDRAGAQGPVFRGLNLLLNEQPDKAIDAFIEVVKLDPEMIELHYALGNLFRRRGEIDRAIRIHTHLLNRGDLPGAERANALFELAQDFLKGGLLDRAEQAFSQLVEDKRHKLEALRALLRVFTMEREWSKAIEVAARLEKVAGESNQVAISHFHCELAEQALAAGDEATAQRHLDKALAVYRKSVRALLLSGDLSLRRRDRAAAIKLWYRVEQEAPEYMAMVAQRLTDALDQEGHRAEALNMLRRVLLDAPSIDLLDVVYQRVGAWEGPAAAEQLLRDELKRNPSLLGFERLLAARAAQDKGDAELDALRSLIHSQAKKLARYRCGKCGFRARDFHWQCPGCTHWDTYAPKRIEELDSV